MPGEDGGEMSLPQGTQWTGEPSGEVFETREYAALSRRHRRKKEKETQYQQSSSRMSSFVNTAWFKILGRRDSK